MADLKNKEVEKLNETVEQISDDALDAVTGGTGTPKFTRVERE